MTKIWATIGAIITAIIGGLFMRNRYVENKNDELEHEIKIKDKQTEIRRDQDQSKSEILEDEKKRIKNAHAPGYTADDLNKL